MTELNGRGRFTAARRVGRALRRRLWVVVAAALVGAVFAAAGTLFSAAPNYTATVDLCLVPSVSQGAGSGSSPSSDDLTATALLVLRSHDTLAQIAEESGLPYSAETVGEALDAYALEGTAALRIETTLFSSSDALALADAAARVLPVRFAELFSGVTVQVVDSAQVLAGAAGPRPEHAAALGAGVCGLVAAVGVAVSVALDDRVRDADLLARRYGKPSLAAVPKLKRREGCSNLSPQAAEAYKLLRANVMRRLPEQGLARVIGVTSAVCDEGKTTTAVNLAYAFAELGKRTLLVDADMRVPGVAPMLKIARAPGLSSVLTGRVAPPYAVQSTRLMSRFLAVTAGDVPSNPTELLGSPRMARLLDVYAEHFDYIVVDLPPVTMVSDALVLAPELDGVAVVARRGFTRRGKLEETMEKLSFADANVLGFVTTRARVDHGYYYESAR